MTRHSNGLPNVSINRGAHSKKPRDLMPGMLEVRTLIFSSHASSVTPTSEAFPLKQILFKRMHRIACMSLMHMAACAVSPQISCIDANVHSSNYHKSGNEHGFTQMIMTSDVVAHSHASRKRVN